MEHEWSKFAASYILHDVRIVAILCGKGSVVEHVPKLEIQEGRFVTYAGYDNKQRSMASLEYSLLFGIPDDPPAEKYVGHEARIVISGTTDEGQRLDIRGKGSFGHSDLGVIDGRFDDVPRIVCPNDEDLAAHVQDHLEEPFGITPVRDFTLATYKA